MRLHIYYKQCGGVYLATPTQHDQLLDSRQLFTQHSSPQALRLKAASMCSALRLQGLHVHAG
jgi:hypothetical protein